MTKWVSLMMALGVATSLGAEAPGPGPQLAGLAFLVGDWQVGQGLIANTGGKATGRSSITLEAGGNVILRRDHTDLFSAAGQPTGSFEQIMMIYPEGGMIHADYSDGKHVVHYVGTDIVAGHAVTFTTMARPDAATFRLRYELAGPKSLMVAFETPRREHEFPPDRHGQPGQTIAMTERECRCCVPAA